MNNFFKTTKSIAVSFVAAAACIAGSAHAGNVLSFSYQPYELQTAKGAEKVFDRLQRSVKNICNENGRQTLATLKAERECRTEMLEHFVSEISHPRITSLYDANMAPTRIAQN